jgi:hypothetical protein
MRYAPLAFSLGSAHVSAVLNDGTCPEEAQLKTSAPLLCLCERLGLMPPKQELGSIGFGLISWPLSCYRTRYQAMKIIEKSITLDELKTMAGQGFGDLIKAAVDIATGVMAIDGELHADEEALLLEKGSHQADLWGSNIYPGLAGRDRIEFDSLINIRPSQGNRSRGVDDPLIKEKISQIMARLVKG